MTNRFAPMGLAALFAATVSTGALAGSDNAADQAQINADGNAATSIDSADGGLSTQVETDMDAGTQMTADSGDAPSNYGQVISSLQGAQGDMADVDEIGADATVETMTLTDLQGSAAGNASALDNALADAETRLSDLHAEIEANADLAAAIEEDGHDVSDVIGVYETADGAVRILVDDRA